MVLVRASLLFGPPNLAAETIELEADNIVDLIATFTKLGGDEVKQYFFLDDRELNGATFVTINGRLFEIHEALNVPLKDGDSIFFGQLIDGG
jgi:molybdopterin converting factor small subunit